MITFSPERFGSPSESTGVGHDLPVDLGT